MSKAESALKKKSNAIAYHAGREAVAMKEILIGYVNTDLNVVDIMTKVLPAGAQRTALIEQMMWDITHVDHGCTEPITDGKESLLGLAG